MSIQGKTTLISGASKGIGLALARGFARGGSHVAMWYNTDPSCIETAASLSREFGVNCRAYQVPIQDQARVAEAVKEARADFGALDIVIANAGEPWGLGFMLDTSPEQYRRHVGVNLHGSYATAHAAGEIFKRQGHGSLIFTASMSATIVNTPYLQAPYNMCKAALVHLAKSLAVEWAAFATVNCVSPGYIATEYYNATPSSFRKDVESRTPIGRAGECDDLVDIYIMLATNRNTTGANVISDGGFTVV